MLFLCKTLEHVVCRFNVTSTSIHMFYFNGYSTENILLDPLTMIQILRSLYITCNLSHIMKLRKNLNAKSDIDIFKQKTSTFLLFYFV